MGADIGRGTARTLASPVKAVGEYLTDLGTTKIPKAGLRRGLVYAGRRGVKTATRALPVVGQALMAADAINAARNIAGPESERLATLPEGSPVDDPMVQALIERWQKGANPWPF